MRNILYGKRTFQSGIAVLVFVLFSITAAHAQINSIQSTWAAPFMTLAPGGDPIPHGAPLEPNTTYYIYLEATAPINPNLFIIQLKSCSAPFGTNAYPTTFPYGLDVPVGPNSRYGRYFQITTGPFQSFMPAINITYTGQVGYYDPNSGLTISHETSPVQTATLP